MITMLYGQPGTGKSTLATGIALDYMREGRRVVCNFPIDPAPASYSPKKGLAFACCEVIPARPAFAVVEKLGIGWRDPKHVGREDLCGLLVIDESGPWLDSRKWNDKDRAQVIDWLLQSRKRGWDVLLIAQAPSLVDKQVREAVVEAYARCRRTDRMKVPVLGVSLPRMHVAVSRYGLDQNAPVLQRWWYRGGLEHQCFQSYALFNAEADTAEHWVVPPPVVTKWADYADPWAEWKQLLADFLERRQRHPVKVPHKSKLPLVEELAKYSELEAIRLWKRYDELGAMPLVSGKTLDGIANSALAAEDRAIMQRGDAIALQLLRQSVA